MSIELKVPEVGESITEVLIGEWLKSEGEHVDRDEEVVVIETDKATLEVAAPEAGTLTRVLKQTGDKASVGDVIGYLEAGEVAAAKAEKKPAAVGKGPAAGKNTPELKPNRETAEERSAGTVRGGTGAEQPSNASPASTARAAAQETEAVRESRA